MIPHERSLVEKWKDRPFALIGVNSDRTNTEKGMALYKEKQKEMGVTWRSFRNEDPSHHMNPLARAWSVRTLPTTFLIGADGTIRVQGGTARDQAKLLRQEGVKVVRGRVDLFDCGWTP